MHVGLIGGNRPDGFMENIGESLRRMGLQTSYLGSTVVTRRGRVGNRAAALVRAAAPALADHAHRRLAQAAIARGCEAVITVQGDLSPAAVADLRRHRVPVALWFPDAVCNLGRQAMLEAPYTVVFFKDPLLVRRLRDLLDLPVCYLPQACNPHWHRPVGEAGADRVVAVVGNLYPSRLRLLGRLHEAGVPLVIYSGTTRNRLRGLVPARLHAGRPVFRQEKARVFRGATAVLNNLHPAEMDGANLRLFEATGAGAAVLCERRPALADLFDPATEVVAFGDFAELLDRVRELLADPALTQKVGDAASRRAHAEHTYEHRLPSILERLV